MPVKNTDQIAASEQRKKIADEITRKAARRLTPETDETFEFNFEVILDAVESAMEQPLPVICCKCGEPKTYVRPAHASEHGADALADAIFELPDFAHIKNVSYTRREWRHMVRLGFKALSQRPTPAWNQWRELLRDGNQRALCWNCGYPELVGSDDCRNCSMNFDPAKRIEVAHASEQGADTAVKRALTLCRQILGKSDNELHIEAVRRINAALSQRPTPATASETTPETFLESLQPCKPDSASTGKEEILQLIDEQVPHFEFAIVRKNGRDVWLHDLIRELAATPSGGGQEWTLEKVEMEYRYRSLHEFFKHIVEAHNATLSQTHRKETQP